MDDESMADDGTRDDGASVVSVARSGEHGFSKTVVGEVRVVAGLGIEGDAHSGRTVKHRSRVARDPSQPNLRQVHLIHSELLEELNGLGFRVAGGSLGENVLTRGVDLLGLPVGSVLHIGAEARLEVTGLRNPCKQLDAFQAGLMHAVIDRDDSGALIRKAGVMALAATGGVIRPGDVIRVTRPPPPYKSLEVV